MRRVEHPAGGSTLITSAPRSANILPHNAPFSSVKSSSRNPLSNSDGIGELNLAKAPARPKIPFRKSHLTGPPARQSRNFISYRAQDVTPTARRELGQCPVLTAGVPSDSAFALSR